MSKHYMANAFTIDFVSTVPFDFIGEALFNTKSATIKVFGALKLIRVLRLNKIIAYLRSTEELKAFLKLIKLTFFLIIYLHCMGCIWWFIVSRDEVWIPPAHFNEEYLYMVYDQDIYYKYFFSLYISIYLTTGHDIAPIGFLQVSISTIGLFLGAIINANIFGELAVLVQQLNRKETAFMIKLT